MIVQFGTTSKRVNSTEQPTMTASYNCVLKEGCSIINPVIIIDRKVVGHSYNTAYIADFGRYYWIRDIVYENARQYFYLECDVLASFKTAIGSSSVYVTRSASDYNGYIVDNMYPLTNEVSMKRNILVSLSRASKGRSYVVTIVGNDATNGVNEQGLHYYGFTPTGLDNFFKQLLSTTYTDQIVDTVWGQLNQNLKLLVDPLQYVACVKMYPFDLVYQTPGQPLKPGEISTKTIPIGFGTITCDCAEWGEGFRDVNIATSSFSITHHPQIARGEYLDGSQFTDCKMYTPLGVFDLDILSLSQATDSCQIKFDADITTGIGRLQVFARDTSYLVDPWDGNTVIDAIGSVGVDVPVSQIIAGGMDYLGGLSGMLGSLGTALTGNYVGAVSGFIGSTVGMIGQGVANSIPKAHTTGQKGSEMNLSRSITIQYLWHIVVDDDNVQHGRPLCEVKQISALSGFLMAEKPDVSITGTREEADRINAYLESGIFYE